MPFAILNAFPQCWFEYIHRTTFPETLANFLIGEGKLESYLEEHPPTEANIPKAKTGLAEARKYLLMCIGEPAKKVRRIISVSTQIILSPREKNHFHCI